MVDLGGPGRRRGRSGRGIYLHDPPPGYHPPRPRIPLQDRQRMARRDRLMRVTTVILVLAVGALAVFIALMLAGYH